MGGIVMPQRSISKGVVKKGLHPASVIHFRCDENFPSTTITSQVDGSVLTRAANSYVSNKQHSVFSAYDTTGSGVVHMASNSHSNTGIKTDGCFVLYSTSQYYPDPDPAAVTDGCLFNIGDSGDATALNEPIFFIEEVNGNFSGLLANNTAELLQFKSRLGLVDGYEDGTTYLPSTFGEPLSYCAVFPMGGVGKLYFSDGNTMSFDRTNDLNKEPSPLILNSWNLNNILIGNRNVDGYVMGALYFKDTPSASDALACAKWHNINAPKGNKDVWYGWGKYNAG